MLAASRPWAQGSQAISAFCRECRLTECHLWKREVVFILAVGTFLRTVLNALKVGMMLAFVPRPTSVSLCVGPTDVRKVFYGMMRVAAEHAARDVLQGGFFVFANRRRDRMKLLW